MRSLACLMLLLWPSAALSEGYSVAERSFVDTFLQKLDYEVRPFELSRYSYNLSGEKNVQTYYDAGRQKYACRIFAPLYFMSTTGTVVVEPNQKYSSLDEAIDDLKVVFMYNEHFVVYFKYRQPELYFARTVDHVYYSDEPLTEFADNVSMLLYLRAVYGD